MLARAARRAGRPGARRCGGAGPRRGSGSPAPRVARRRRAARRAARAASRGESQTGNSSSNSSRTPASQFVIDQRAGRERVEDARVDGVVAQRRAPAVSSRTSLRATSRSPASSSYGAGPRAERRQPRRPRPSSGRRSRASPRRGASARLDRAVLAPVVAGEDVVGGALRVRRRAARSAPGSWRAGRRIGRPAGPLLDQLALVRATRRGRRRSRSNHGRSSQRSVQLRIQAIDVGTGPGRARSRSGRAARARSRGPSGRRTSGRPCAPT